MQISLSKRGDYAVRAVLDLARHEGDGRRKTREIAAAMNIPAGYLSQILAALVQSGLVVATAGRDGGYRLARPADAVSLLDVIRAIDGPVGVQECLLRGIPCGADGFCAVHEAWSRAQEALNEELASTRFAELARRG
ncbi:MAG: Rrf2 family transcriptional regulator [Anaerolineae bacterium]